MSDTTFIVRLDEPGEGPRLAIKDLIDVAGIPTTAGSRAVADRATPAAHDAACLAGARAAGARIVGKANLHELACGATGFNPWFGTAVNPLDPALVPGGSSSGSAVAVATGEADVGYGTDTAGSVRIPPACCGVTGLKTTWGRIPAQGIWPLAPSYDTVGPIARNVGGLVQGMTLLEPGFAIEPWSPSVVGRLRLTAAPHIDAAVDAALAATGWQVVDVDLPEWQSLGWGAAPILMAEAWESDRRLVETAPESVSPGATAFLQIGKAHAEFLASAHQAAEEWKRALRTVFERVELLVLPTLGVVPPEITAGGDDTVLAAATLPVNTAGVPALAMPVPTPGARVPASLQLIGPWDAEERLLAAAAVVEAAVGPGPFG